MIQKYAAHLSVKKISKWSKYSWILHTFVDILKFGGATAHLCVAAHRLRSTDETRNTEKTTAMFYAIKQSSQTRRWVCVARTHLKNWHCYKFWSNLTKFESSLVKCDWKIFQTSPRKNFLLEFGPPINMSLRNCHKAFPIN